MAATSLSEQMNPLELASTQLVPNTITLGHRSQTIELLATDDALSEHLRRSEVAAHDDSAGVVCRLRSAWNLWLGGYPDTRLRAVSQRALQRMLAAGFAHLGRMDLAQEMAGSTRRHI
ncbi:hypothetical protein RA19_23030 [Leisingera sp. ANG-M1]|nr:hypothetical protein RA19_23030 [Leisingera sp. ANG-M1]